MIAWPEPSVARDQDIVKRAVAGAGDLKLAAVIGARQQDDVVVGGRMR